MSPFTCLLPKYILQRLRLKVRIQSAGGRVDQVDSQVSKAHLSHKSGGYVWYDKLELQKAVVYQNSRESGI